jgi:TCP-1/cpn60 chaperonin family
MRSSLLDYCTGVSQTTATHLYFVSVNADSQLLRAYNCVPSQLHTQARTATIVLRGGTEQFLAESQRSMHDALMVVKRSMKACEVVAGGGAIEVTQ